MLSAITLSFLVTLLTTLNTEGFSGLMSGFCRIVGIRLLGHQISILLLVRGSMMFSLFVQNNQ